MRLIILFPIILIICVYVIVAMTVPAYQSASATKKLNNEKIGEIQLQEEQLDSIKKFVASLASQPENVAFLEKFVPKNRTEQGVINSISKYAASSGLQITDMSLNSEREGGIASGSEPQQFDTSLLKASVVVSGNYNQILNFMQNMFVIERLYTLSAASIDKQERQQGENGDFIGNPDTLVLSMEISYGYVATSQRVTTSNFAEITRMIGQVGLIQSATRVVNPITGVGVQRGNPFLP